eukprot:scaffold14200_cov134-Skeletonema_dohrnii-CCMP3373.AAC.1
MNYGSNADGRISCNWAEQVCIYLGVLSYGNADVGITPLYELRQLMPNGVRMLVHHDGLASSGRNCIKLSLDDAYEADYWISVKLTISNGYAITAWGEITSSLLDASNVDVPNMVYNTYPSPQDEALLGIISSYLVLEVCGEHRLVQLLAQHSLLGLHIFHRNAVWGDLSWTPTTAYAIFKVDIVASSPSIQVYSPIVAIIVGLSLKLLASYKNDGESLFMDMCCVLHHREVVVAVYLHASLSVGRFPWKLLLVFSIETAYYLHAVPSFSDSALASSILPQDFGFSLGALSVKCSIVMPREPSNLVACTPSVLLHDSFNAQSVVELRGFTFAALPPIVPLAFNSDACYSSDAYYTARTQQFSCMHS